MYIDALCALYKVQHRHTGEKLFRRCISCLGPTNPESATEKWFTDFVKECPTPTAERF